MVKSPDKGVLQTQSYKQLFLESGMSLAISSAALGLHLEFHALTSSQLLPAQSFPWLALVGQQVGNWRH